MDSNLFLWIIGGFALMFIITLIISVFSFKHPSKEYDDKEFFREKNPKDAPK
jgi:hypothetical protein